MNQVGSIDSLVEDFPETDFYLVYIRESLTQAENGPRSERASCLPPIAATVLLDDENDSAAEFFDAHPLRTVHLDSGGKILFKSSLGGPDHRMVLDVRKSLDRS